MLHYHDLPVSPREHLALAGIGEILFFISQASRCLRLMQWIRPPTFVVNQFGLSDSATAVRPSLSSVFLCIDSPDIGHTRQ